MSRARARAVGPLVLSLALGLGGCVTTGEPRTTATGPKSESAAVLDAPSEADRAMAERNSRLARLQQTTSQSLMGMPGRDVTALLGYPRFVREEQVARVWQYAAGECVLDLFLYPALAQPADYEVVHVEARHRRVIAPVSLKDCFGGVVQIQVSALTAGDS